MDPIIIEYIGYAAMAVLLFSFTRKDIKKLRLLNSVGCLLFVIYGFLVSGYPIVATNLAIIGINCYYLFVDSKASKSTINKG